MPVQDGALFIAVRAEGVNREVLKRLRVGMPLGTDLSAAQEMVSRLEKNGYHCELTQYQRTTSFGPQFKTLYTSPEFRFYRWAPASAEYRRVVGKVFDNR